MKIQEARVIIKGEGAAHQASPPWVLLAALTMAAVLDEIERDCRDARGYISVEQILSTLNGERP